MAARIARRLADEVLLARHSLATYCLACAVVGLAAAHLVDVYAPLL